VERRDDLPVRGELRLLMQCVGGVFLRSWSSIPLVKFYDEFGMCVRETREAAMEEEVRYTHPCSMSGCLWCLPPRCVRETVEGYSLHRPQCVFLVM
jgi:hypothetical protein